NTSRPLNSFSSKLGLIKISFEFSMLDKIFDQILAQSGCEGLRMYFAIEPDGTKTLVVVGIDSVENDITKGLIAENFGPCPKRCPQPNALNS
ncbi:MAG: hypothetical protein EBR41_01145, partial [Crocinitomicaceae bacterium]|nr:hypothetical protein [Crocinitomicaceae bacterium]